MGWQDAPVVEEPSPAAQPAWASAPEEPQAADTRDAREIAMDKARHDTRPFWDKLMDGFGSAQDWSNAAGGLKTELRETAKGVPIAGALVEQTPEMTAYEQAHPGRAAVSKGIGATAAMLPAMAAAPELFGAGVAQSLRERIGMGAASSGLTQFADSKARGKSAEEAMTDAKHSAAFSAAAVPAASVISEFMAPTLQKGADALAAAGVKMTPGQLTGGTIKRLEDIGESMPILGVGVRDARARSIESFNRAAENEALAPLGQKVPEAVEPGYEGRKYVGKAIGDAYKGAYEGAAMTATPQLSQDIAAVTQNAATGRLLPAPQLEQLDKVIQHKIAGKFNAAGSPLGGDAINNIDSELRLLSDRYRTDPSADNRELSEAIGDLRTAFNKHFAAQNPQAAQQLKTADQAYANYVRSAPGGKLHGGPGR